MRTSFMCQIRLLRSDKWERSIPRVLSIEHGTVFSSSGSINHHWSTFKHNAQNWSFHVQFIRDLTNNGGKTTITGTFSSFLVQFFMDYQNFIELFNEYPTFHENFRFISIILVKFFDELSSLMTNWPLPPLPLNPSSRDTMTVEWRFDPSPLISGVIAQWRHLWTFPMRDVPKWRRRSVFH